MPASEKTRQRAADALGEEIDAAVVAYRYAHPAAGGVVAVALVILNPMFGADYQWLRLAVLYLALEALHLMSRPTVVLARCGTEVVVLRTSLLRPYMPSSRVIARYGPDTPRAIGPTSWDFQPVTVSYHRFWVRSTHRAAAQRLLGLTENSITGN
jgi:hypothetical protein